MNAPLYSIYRGVLKICLIFVALACAGFCGVIANAQQLYWTDQNLSTIDRSVLIRKWPRLVALPARPVLTNELYSYLAIDRLRQKIYFTVSSPDPAQLFRSRPDGSKRELLLTFDEANIPRGLAVDAAGGKIYWSSFHGYQAGNGKIRRANLDGSGLEDLVTGMVYPYGMALDLRGGQMFWIRQESNSIWRANLDGSQAASFLSLGEMSYAFSLAIDPRTARIFWTDPFAGIIGRANLDGSDVRAIATLPLTSLDSGITVDPVSGMVMWGDTFNHEIRTATQNGAMNHVIVSKGVSYPMSLDVLVPYWRLPKNAY